MILNINPLQDVLSDRTGQTRSLKVRVQNVTEVIVKKHYPQNALIISKVRVLISTYVVFRML